MILGFACDDTENLFRFAICPPAWRAFKAVALRKLDMLHAARDLRDLRSPPANRLEKLERGRKGQHSIRINDQWRVCFKWTAAGPEDVEIVDYH